MLLEVTEQNGQRWLSDSQKMTSEIFFIVSLTRSTFRCAHFQSFIEGWKWRGAFHLPAEYNTHLQACDRLCRLKSTIHGFGKGFLSSKWDSPANINLPYVHLIQLQCDLSVELICIHFSYFCNFYPSQITLVWSFFTLNEIISLLRIKILYSLFLHNPWHNFLHIDPFKTLILF